MWEAVEERLALLELLVRGVLKRRTAQAGAYEVLAELPWTRATGRSGEIGLVAGRRGDLVALLDRVWPAWGDALVELAAAGSPPTPAGWGDLLDARRIGNLPPLPERLNRRTAAALTAEHSKSVLTERRLSALGETESMHDGMVRIRPPERLLARTRSGVLDLAVVSSVLGEAAIPERAFKDELVFEGRLRAVLLVENLGAWRDLPKPEGWLYAHVPGWDTAAAVQLLDAVPSSVPVIHFGDLDPNGVRIFMHLRARRGDIRWFVPSFWRESMESRGLRNVWPEDFGSAELPSIVRELVAKGLWLEQEPLVVDPRIVGELERMVPGS